MPPHLPRIRLIQPGQQPQKRGFADAVGPNQANPLAGIQFEANILEQGNMIKPTRQVGTA
jgi:hypothetical protein